MKVHKSVEINTGNGSPGDIVAAINRHPFLPAGAVATKIEIDFMIDHLLDSSLIFKTGHVTTFEWDEEIDFGESLVD